MEGSVRERLASIESKLDGINTRQEAWYKLLTDRIEKYDQTRTQVSILMKVVGALGISIIGVIVKLVFEK